MELLKVFLIALAGVITLMFLLQLFARWKAGRSVGKEFTKFGRDVVLYFYSPSCGACQRMNPVIDKLSKKVRVKKIDVSKKEGLWVAKELGILGTPTTVIIEKGKVAKVLFGIQKEDKLLKEVGK
ncbi:MAG: thioredoxin family protein [Aquificae bacterium]|nr:thioredoxin family protein [Aquificota bacterium]